jgi:hypothetical protein
MLLLRKNAANSERVRCRQLHSDFGDVANFPKLQNFRKIAGDVGNYLFKFFFLQNAVVKDVKRFAIIYGNAYCVFFELKFVLIMVG